MNFASVCSTLERRFLTKQLNILKPNIFHRNNVRYLSEEPRETVTIQELLKNLKPEDVNVENSTFLEKYRPIAEPVVPVTVEPTSPSMFDGVSDILSSISTYDPIVLPLGMLILFLSHYYPYHQPNRMTIVTDAQKFITSVKIFNKMGYSAQESIAMSSNSRFNDVKSVAFALIKLSYLPQIVYIILIVFYMFYIINRSLDFYKDRKFLWIPDLSNPDPYYVIPVCLLIFSSYMITKAPMSIPIKLAITGVSAVVTYFVISNAKPCNIVFFISFGLFSTLLKKYYPLPLPNVKLDLQKIQKLYSKKATSSSAKKEYKNKLKNREFLIKSRITKDSFAPKNSLEFFKSK